MPDESSTFTSTGSVQTFLAGAFIIALFALGMSIYNFSRTTSAISALLDLQDAAVTHTAGAKDQQITALQKQVTDLDTRVKALEAASAAPAPAPAPGK